jgi:hypothetical protein
MIHTIEKLKEPLTFVDDHKKTISVNGYAFMDEFGRCIIMVYGEGRRDSMSKYLSGDTDELHIKYHTIDLMPT